MCALSSEAIFLAKVSDLLGQISDVTTQLVVPKINSRKILLTQRSQQSEVIVYYCIQITQMFPRSD